MLIVENKDVVSGVQSDVAVKLILVSHLALQVHLGPKGEEKLYNISITFVTGVHEGSPAFLRNTMRESSTITVMNKEKTIERYTTCNKVLNT